MFISTYIQRDITQYELRELSNILSSSTIYYQEYYFYNYINVIYDQYRIFHWGNWGSCLVNKNNCINKKKCKLL